MEKFKDVLGYEWLIEFNLNSVDRIKAMEGIDLLDLSERGPLVQMELDYRLVATVLYRFCEEQCERMGLSVTDFMSRLKGDALEDGMAAVRRSATDFFPKSKRPMLLAMMQKTDLLRKKAAEVTEKGLQIPNFEEKIEKVLNAQVSQFHRQFDDLLETKLETLSGSAEASSGSILGPSHLDG